MRETIHGESGLLMDSTGTTLLEFEQWSLMIDDSAPPACKFRLTCLPSEPFDLGELLGTKALQLRIANQDYRHVVMTVEATNTKDGLGSMRVSGAFVAPAPLEKSAYSWLTDPERRVEPVPEESKAT
jgi:hypothetical protein